MSNYMQQQYEYVCGSRKVVFQSLNELSEEELIHPISAFNDKNIRYFIIHIHNVYIHWIGNFALKKVMHYKEEAEIKTPQQLAELFENTNQLMHAFFNSYADNLDKMISGTLNQKQVDVNALELFTHVITHEFHHKGQVMSAFRLLGKIPPDNDVIRT